MDIIIERIVKLIKQRNIPEASFAADIGMGKNTVNNWKAGRSKTYLKKIEEISDYFGVSVDYLLGRTDDPLPKIQIQDTIMAKGDYVGPVNPAEKGMLQKIPAQSDDRQEDCPSRCQTACQCLLQQDCNRDIWNNTKSRRQNR